MNCIQKKVDLFSAVYCFIVHLRLRQRSHTHVSVDNVEEFLFDNIYYYNTLL